jgi:DNA-binding HxlR family transcriptional regulator
LFYLNLIIALKKIKSPKEKQGMPEVNYSHLISEIKTLKLSDQLRLLEEMAILIRKKAGESRPRSILELRGKGKKIWKDLDVQNYIDEERSSWNG